MIKANKGTAPKQEVEPRDPVAYPTYPKRVEGARRPVWEPIEKEDGAQTSDDEKADR